jgi:hypothetical protein
MTTENYKRACEIQDEAKVLGKHLSDLIESKAHEKSGYCQFYRCDNYHQSIKLFPEFMPPSFFDDYARRIEARATELRNEFESL